MSFGSRYSLKRLTSVAVLAFAAITRGDYMEERPLPDSRVRQAVPVSGQASTQGTIQSSTMCVYAGEDIANPSEEQKSLQSLFNEAGRSAMGADVVGTLKKHKTKVCYAPELETQRSCGFRKIGRILLSKNLIKINPSPDLRDSVIRTLVHEARHKQQKVAVPKSYTGGNVPESELMIMKWLKEADARLSEIVFAYEMKQQGVSYYMDDLEQSNTSGHMARAFMDTLHAGKGIEETMRAVIRSFRDNEDLANKYDNNMLEYIEEEKYGFDPTSPRDEFLTNSAFQRLGEMGHYPNYMNDELMDFIRNSVTQEDFEELSALRKVSGGTKGAACRRPSKPAAPLSS